ncbi:hypothetical protein HELRODRAFT_65173, partial [Helobdella robusta]|uniref:FH2 domain-containing protein n=1 Tax=Helobdella robusta TaxID=6412 RepID=T1FY41_HELRO
SNKPVVKPNLAMKPLFWKKIQVDTVGTYCLWEILKEPDVDFSEFEDMFSKTATKKKTSSIINKKLKSKEKPEEAEIETIRSFMQQQPDASLDRPEQFIYELSSIPCFADRCYCFIFQSTFVESLASIEQRLVNIRLVTECLMNSQEIQKIMAMILAFGNYMNGGTIRGQADGFALDILSKLKDVKNKDNTFSLLEYLVTTYLRSKLPSLKDHNMPLPVPEPSDVMQAANVNFDDLEAELNKVSNSLESCMSKVACVLRGSSPATLEPFQSKMNKFIIYARQSLQEQENNLKDSVKKFNNCVTFFMVKPKPAESSVSPKDFFSLWFSFCQDFKDIWKKEIQKILKERYTKFHNLNFICFSFMNVPSFLIHKK